MRTYITSLCLVFILLLQLGCEETLDPTADLEKAVLEGFLYANSPVDSIRITNLVTYGTDAESVPSTINLDVHLSWNGLAYLMSPTSGDSGYYHYSGTDLEILPGETYGISFEYAGKSVSATTTLPMPPTGLAMETETLLVEQVVFGQGMPGGGGGQTDEPAEIKWDNPSGEFYFVVVENIEVNPASIFVNVPFERNFNFVTEPTSSDFFLLERRVLEQYGTHRAVVYRVNQEYVDLYENSEQDSRNLNEPLSNVENGLGVFTGFSSDTIFFEVAQP